MKSHPHSHLETPHAFFIDLLGVKVVHGVGEVLTASIIHDEPGGGEEEAVEQVVEQLFAELLLVDALTGEQYLDEAKVAGQQGVVRVAYVGVL